MEKNNHATSTVNGLFSNDEVILNKKRKKLRQYSLESYHIEIAKRIVVSPCKFLYRSIDSEIVYKNIIL